MSIKNIHKHTYMPKNNSINNIEGKYKKISSLQEKFYKRYKFQLLSLIQEHAFYFSYKTCIT